jgi:hypothetical protein
MKRFPPDSLRTREQRARERQPLRETEEHRDHEEHAATRDWLAHINAVRIQVR